MQTQYRYLAELDEERIHHYSLRILAEVGVKFRSAKARAILKANGASVDPDSQVVRIPAEMVEQALTTAPQSFTLGARNPLFDFVLPSAFTGYTLDGAATFAVDFKTGERRYATTPDLAASLQIFEALPLGTVELCP